MNRRQILACGLFLASLLSSRGVSGQLPETPAAVAWHTVRPGETLERIAELYLGSSRLWPDIRRLNPTLANPDRLLPGQRLRIPAFRSRATAARLSRISRQVEEQPQPFPWQDAQVGNMLVERDSVRTYRKSSAEMRFQDGARLVVTEDSLVFLRPTGSRPRGAAPRAVEIVAGQADLEGSAATAQPGLPPLADIEVVLGTTHATSRADAAGAARTRARRPQEGGAKLMTYGGESEVEAGGAKVRVPRGMGTSVAAQGPPSPPEPLLPAPRPIAPAGGAERTCADPLFSWEPLPGAASYTLEVCRDEACAELVERHTGETATRWRPEALPVGGLYWRLTARAGSGLDGYPSETSPLAITSDRVAQPPPTGALAITGPQVQVDDRLIVGPGAQLAVATRDSLGAAATWTPLVGGREESAWPAPWSAGEQAAGAIVHDGCGQSTTLAPLHFLVDTAPPAIRWEVGDRRSFVDRFLLAPAPEPARRRHHHSRPENAWPVAAGVWQVPLPWVGDADAAFLASAELPVVVVSGDPQAFLAAPETVASVDGTDSDLNGRLLWLTAADAEAGVDRLTLRLRPEGDHFVLAIEAADLAGNVGRKEIVLRWRTAGRDRP